MSLSHLGLHCFRYSGVHESQQQARRLFSYSFHRYAELKLLCDWQRFASSLVVVRLCNRWLKGTIQWELVPYDFPVILLHIIDLSLI